MVSGNVLRRTLLSALLVFSPTHRHLLLFFRCSSVCCVFLHVELIVLPLRLKKIFVEVYTSGVGLNVLLSICVVLPCLLNPSHLVSPSLSPCLNMSVCFILIIFYSNFLCLWSHACNIQQREDVRLCDGAASSAIARCAET